jgi:hypothetical protein
VPERRCSSCSCYFWAYSGSFCWGCPFSCCSSGFRVGAGALNVRRPPPSSDHRFSGCCPGVSSPAGVSAAVGRDFLDRALGPDGSWNGNASETGRIPIRHPGRNRTIAEALDTASRSGQSSARGPLTAGSRRTPCPANRGADPRSTSHAPQAGHAMKFRRAGRDACPPGAPPAPLQD